MERIFAKELLSVPYVVSTEAMIEKIFNCENSWDVYKQVTKMTTNYRVWSVVTEYFTQAGYLITDKIKELKGNEGD